MINGNLVIIFATHHQAKAGLVTYQELLQINKKSGRKDTDMSQHRKPHGFETGDVKLAFKTSMG